MIPNTDPSIYAVFYTPDASTPVVYRPVVGWDDDGDALVPAENGSLRAAVRYATFEGISTAPGTDPGERYVQIMPADGWVAHLTSDEGTSTQPLIAWALQANGDVVPLISDSTGWVEEAKAAPGEELRLDHPAQQHEEPTR